MKHALHDLVTDQRFPLAHRVRSAAIDTAGRTPGLILLHGVGANELQLVDFAQRQDPRLLVVCARGPLVLGPMQFGWFRVNFTPTGPVIDAEQAEQSRRTLIAFTQEVVAAYDVDPQRIWLAGFSQGGIMSASVALTAPSQVAGFGILSGRVLPEIAPHTGDRSALRNLHAFVSHGIHDAKLGIQFARNAQGLIAGLGVALHYQEYLAGHELNGAMQQDFCAWMTRQIG